jgi:hypothetical protein
MKDQSSAELQVTKEWWLYRNQNQPRLKEISIPIGLEGAPKSTDWYRVAAGYLSMSLLLKRSLADSTCVCGRRVNQCTWRWNNKWIQKKTMWTPRQVTASTPGDKAESLLGGKPASVHSNWRWYDLQAQGGCQVYKCTELGPSALTWRIIGATASAPERWSYDQVSVICAEQERLCLPKQFRMGSGMISEHTKLNTELHHMRVTENHSERQPPNCIMSDSWDHYTVMMTEHSDQDLGWMAPNWDSIRGLSGAIYRQHQLGSIPHGIPKWMLNDHTGGL